MKKQRTIVFRVMGLISVWLSLICLLSCQSPKVLRQFSAEASSGSAGALTVMGSCEVPDGTQIMIRAQGAVAFGAQVEQAVLAPVREGRFEADLGLHETLAYLVTVSLSPAWNAAGALPAEPPEVSDPELHIVAYNDTWEVKRHFETRLGTAEREKQLLAKHLKGLADAQKALERSADTLRELERGADRKELSRWFRLHYDRQRGTALADEGIDPIFPIIHSRLKQAEEAMMKRFHAVLAKLTGAAEEKDKMSSGWQTVERQIKKAREMILEVEKKLAE